MGKLISREELQQVHNIQSTALLIAQLVIKRFNDTRITSTRKYCLDNRMLQKENAICLDVQISEGGLMIHYSESDNKYDDGTLFVPADAIADNATLDEYINSTISEWYNKRSAELKKERDYFDKTEYQEYLRLKEKFENKQ